MLEPEQRALRGRIRPALGPFFLRGRALAHVKRPLAVRGRLDPGGGASKLRSSRRGERRLEQRRNLDVRADRAARMDSERAVREAGFERVIARKKIEVPRKQRERGGQVSRA